MGMIWVHNARMVVSPETLAEYRAGLAELEAQRLRARLARNEHARTVARAAERVLKERFILRFCGFL